MIIQTGVDSATKAPSKGCQHYAHLSEMPWDIQKSVYTAIHFLSKLH